jgi:hypothetical protein
MTAPTLWYVIGGLLTLTSIPKPPTFTTMNSTRPFRWRFAMNPSRSSRYPDRSWGKTSLPITSFGLANGSVQPRSSFGITSTIGCGRCPVDLVRDARYARYNVAGGHFPVGLNPLRLHSPCDLLAKPGLLAACIAPHPYLSGPAISPPVCIHRTLRPNGSSPTGIGDGDFLSFHCCTSWRTVMSVSSVAMSRTKWSKRPWRRKSSGNVRLMHRG